MKIDRRKPLHWAYLIASTFWVMLAIVMRPFRRREARSTHVVLYGHKLSGNLLAMYRGLRANPAFDVVFLTLDPVYRTQLSEQGEKVVCIASPQCLRVLATADALISDHGLHALRPLLSLSDMKFFDVWHGIPFKGFDADDFRVQHRYDEVWVASSSQRNLYIDKFGFDPDIVHATGYARTDRLVRRYDDLDSIKRGLGLDPVTCGKLVLFAPTWKQDASERSLFPFGLDELEFMRALSGLAERVDATVLLRTHLNSGDQITTMPERVVSLPYARFPDTESILLITDVLICDWSSIAFDFLLLDRPALFLNVVPPFRKGFSLGPEFRYGSIVADLPGLIRELDLAVSQPDQYWISHRRQHEAVRAQVYGDRADGSSTQRCLTRLINALNAGG